MTSRALGRACAAVAVLTLLAVAGRPATAAASTRHADRVAGTVTPAAPQATLPDEPQASADMPVAVPSTPSCVDTLTVHDFAFSYGAPATGGYAPPAACPGPWSKVVLTLTSTVGGNQFDRSLTVSVGDVVMLHGTTSEPCCTTMNTVSWSVQRDVTAYSTVLATASTFAVQLDNIVDSTYTGVYHTTVTLTFYETGATAPAAAVPDVVVPVSTGNPAGEEYNIGADGQRVGRAVTFPRNLVRLNAELFTNGQGGCEEFWWSEPGQCSVGGPYREVAVYLDGALAGAAPVFPTVFTGGDGPGLWEPVPSPRTWNLRPYDVDLGPFVSTLTDGQPHQVTLGVLDSAIKSGDFWPVAANLLGTVDAGEAVAAGALTSSSAPPAPTDDTSGSTQATYNDVASHDLSWSGFVTTSTGIITDTVTETSSANATEDSVAGVATNTSWAWSTESLVEQTYGNQQPAQTTDTHVTGSYSIITSALTHFSFTDNARTDVTVAHAGLGLQPSWNEFDDSMDTTDTSGLAFNGVQHQEYRYGDSNGTCYDRTVTGTAGVPTSVDGPNCPGASPVAVPESPLAGLLPAGAAGLVMSAELARSRRRRREPRRAASGRGGCRPR